MNPLSIWAFYRRHKGHTALLLGIISLVTVGLYLLVALSWAIFIEPTRTNRQFLSKFNIVMPHGDEWAATVVAQIHAHPGIEYVIPVVAGQGVSLPEVIGGGTDWFGLVGVREQDMAIIMEKHGATVKEGHTLQPRSNGIMLSQDVAANLGLHVGDVVHNTVNPKSYSNIADPLEVVAILGSDVRLGVLSAEYMNKHEIYRSLPIRFLVVAQPGREAEVDTFLRNETQSAQTLVWTLQTLNEQMAREYQKTLVLIITLITIVAVTVALVTGAINHIAFARCIPEFGALRAAGYGRHWLTRRLTTETAVLATLGWVLGVVLSWGVLYGLKLAVFDPRGHTLSRITTAPAPLVLLVPLAVVGFARVGYRRLLARMDAVTIIERGELGPEAQSHPTAMTASSPRPLAAVQNLVYCPHSLIMGFFDLTPWLLTMALPLTVVLIST